MARTTTANQQNGNRQEWESKFHVAAAVGWPALSNSEVCVGRDGILTLMVTGSFWTSFLSRAI